MRAISPRRLGAAVVVAALAGLAAWYVLAHGRVQREQTGLFTSLPIAWNEAGSVGAILQSEEAPHWAREALASGGRLVPLDTLDAKTLTPLGDLVIAQPRPLSPLENVALDGWVRHGGRLLLIADPALTEPSIFPLGDPRRPQPVVLLSPILTRWGLELHIDETQPPGPRVATGLGQPMEVDLPGQFEAIAGGSCRTFDGGLVAQCRIGKGRVLLLADAALLRRDGTSRTDTRALARLLKTAFPAD